jgi:hypothetical protein
VASLIERAMLQEANPWSKGAHLVAGVSDGGRRVDGTSSYQPKALRRQGVGYSTAVGSGRDPLKASPLGCRWHWLPSLGVIAQPRDSWTLGLGSGADLAPAFGVVRTKMKSPPSWIDLIGA